MIDTLTHIVCGEPLHLNGITAYNPTLAQIRAFGEEQYLTAVQLLLCRPHDVIALLEDMGMDFEKMHPVMFFCQNLKSIQPEALALLVDLPAPAGLFLAEHAETKELVLLDRESDFVLRQEDIALLQDYIARINFIKPSEKPHFGNAITREFWIDKQRQRMRRAKQEPFTSHLAGIISGLVNTPGFKYGYREVWELHISQLFDALYRVGRIADYKFTMSAVYGGTIPYDKIEKAALNWTDGYKL